MKKYLILTALLCLLFSIHCNNHERKNLLKEKKETWPLVQKKLKSLALPDLFFPMLFHDDNYLYVFSPSTTGNSENQTVVRKIDTELHVIEEKIFLEGMGPNDLTGNAFFFAFNRDIYAPDNLQGRINVFDQQLKFKWSKPVAPYSFMVLIENGHYFIGTRRESSKDNNSFSYVSELVSFPQMQRKVFNTIGPIKNKEQNKILKGETPEFCFFYHIDKNKGKIYVVNYKTYEFRIFDLAGQLIQSARVDVKPEKVPAEMRQSWLIDQTSKNKSHSYLLTDWIQPVARVIPLEKGFVVIRRHTYAMECKGSLEGDYFDYELNMIGKVQFPCFFNVNKLLGSFHVCMATSFKGDLFLVNDYNEDFFLEKWQLKE